MLHVPAVQFAHPDVQMKFDVDPAAAETTREAVLSRTVREGDLVAGAHLFFPGLGRVRKAATGYAWLPLAYPGQ